MSQQQQQTTMKVQPKKIGMAMKGPIMSSKGQFGKGVASKGNSPKPLKKSKAKVGKGSSKMPSKQAVMKSVSKTMGY